MSELPEQVENGTETKFTLTVPQKVISPPAEPMVVTRPAPVSAPTPPSPAPMQPVRMGRRTAIIGGVALVSAAVAPRRSGAQSGATVTVAPLPVIAPTATTTPTTETAPSRGTMPMNLADTQVFRYAEGPFLNGLDPAIITSPYITPSMFEGLINVNPQDGTFESAMAESYSSNADATMWTYKVRSGLKWSDGMPLTAKDFEYSWRRVMDPVTRSRYTSALYAIKNAKEVEQGQVPPEQLGVKAIDNHTFEVTLVEPIPFFPLISSTWTCFPTPQQAIARLGDTWVNGPNVISNGPFLLKEWKQDQRVILEPNPNYFGQKPYLTQVQVTQFDDVLAKGTPAFENNELDDVQVAAGDFDRVKGNLSLSMQLKAWPQSSTFWYTMDCTNTPTDDVRVRQALYLGFDRKTLIETVLKDYYTDAPTMLPPDIPGYNPMAALTGGIEKAKQLLADAGYRDGEGFPEDFTFVYSSAVASIQKPVLEFLQAEYQKNLGINIQIQALDAKTYPQFSTARSNGLKFNAALGMWGSDYRDPSNWHNQLFASNVTYYGSHWKDDSYDQLVAKAKSEPDTDTRIMMYQQAEMLLVQSASHMTLFHGQSFYLSRPTLQGVCHPPILGTTPKYKYIYYTNESGTGSVDDGM